MQKTIGGDRLGAGKKMKVQLHGYERSTHNLGYLWRSTMAAGTLVPFIKEVALPGDTFDINLNVDIKTHPTTGPLFGSYKVQLDTFHCPVRLYQGQLHNNKLGIGMNMANVKLPQITLFVDPAEPIPDDDADNTQINPSCLLSFLDIRGIGQVNIAEVGLQERTFDAGPLLSYWDTVKNYYANKQEDLAYVIHRAIPAISSTIDTISIEIPIGTSQLIPEAPVTDVLLADTFNPMSITYTGAAPTLDTYILSTSRGELILADVLGTISGGAGTYTTYWNGPIPTAIYSWRIATNADLPVTAPTPFPFTLENIDTMRERILADVGNTGPFDVNQQTLEPYSLLLDWQNGLSPYKNTQEGLALKTYQSDLFNNWMNTDWIDGVNGINEITAIDTTGGSITIDTINLSKKVYNMLTRIAISGGSYNDWLDVTYDHDRYILPESPVYHGGLIKELVFQEVISNSNSETSDNSQPLGTLGGRGVLSSKHKGGNVTIKIDEPSYILGIISITPRIDYSQGNKWDVHLQTMDDFHKPALDEIGFEDLITEQMAWWTTEKTLAGPWVQKSAGKQPAWINYMTNVNKTRGNFAIRDNEMFMTLNRRYEKGLTTSAMKDLTTYIDPSKFNWSFAETNIDAQNFWAQISVDITARRKMSARIMPNV